MKASELSGSSRLLDASIVISLHRWSILDPTFKASAFLVFPPVSWRWACHTSISSHLSLGTLPADQPQLIATTLWRGCFLSSCSGFYIRAPRPASQEGLMGNQSSEVVAARVEIVRTVSRRSPRLCDSLSLSLSPLLSTLYVRVPLDTWGPAPPSLFWIISQQ